MNTKDKLTILADAAKYDASCSSSGTQRKETRGGIGNSEGMGICHSYTPDGRCISLLKILLTNSCVYDCSYCINRVSSQVKRAKFSPFEVVQLTLEFYRRNYIEGLFLSSGVIKSSDETMEEMVEVARSLREDHKFGGYIHLKAVAGCSQLLLDQAGKYADRLSANIEMPKQKDLDQLAPAKTHREIEVSMSHMATKIYESKEERKTSVKAPIFAPGGQSTQMIVGATPSTDQDILKTSTKLYTEHHLKRVYYSAFSPIPDSDPKLPLKSPPLIREHRLYQADWLMRSYGFHSKELTTEEAPNLDLEIDPKLSWALRNRHFFPVNVNTASREQLLRIPGLGVRNIERILNIRRFHAVTFADMVKMRVPMDRAKYFILTADVNPSAHLLDRKGLVDQIVRPAVQLELFEVRSGEF